MRKVYILKDTLLTRKTSIKLLSDLVNNNAYTFLPDRCEASSDYFCDS